MPTKEKISKWYIQATSQLSLIHISSEIEDIPAIEDMVDGEVDDEEDEEGEFVIVEDDEDDELDDDDKEPSGLSADDIVPDDEDDQAKEL